MRNNDLTGFFRVLTLACAVSAAAGTGIAATGPAAPPDSVRAVKSAHPPLWISAVQIFEANKNLVPGRALQEIQELDDKGGVKSRTNVDISIALDKTGTVRSDVVKASKDGKDITAEERKKAAERETKQAEREKKEAAKSAKAAKKAGEKDSKDGAGDDSGEREHSFSMDDSPFNPERQNVVRVAQTKSRETIDGASCVRFEFSYPEKAKPGSKDKPAMVKGTAWIDETSGRAVKVESTTDPLPKHAKSMRTTLRYGAGADGSWILSRMTFEGHGSFLIFSKRIRGDILFSDYWKYEEPAASK